MRNGRFHFPLSCWRRSRSVAVESRGPRRARGFTLLELLVAITLFGLIALMLLAGLRFGTRAWEAGVAGAEQAAEVQLAQSFLRRELSQARAPDGRQGPEGPAFEGTREAVHFIAPLPDHVGVSGLYRLSVYVAGEPGEKRLMASWRLVRRDEDAEPTEAESGETLLLERIADAEFSYLGREEGAPRDWQDSWQDEEGLPALVRVRVEFDEDDRTWPDLVVAPRIARGA